MIDIVVVLATQLNKIQNTQLHVILLSTNKSMTKHPASSHRLRIVLKYFFFQNEFMFSRISW